MNKFYLVAILLLLGPVSNAQYWRPYGDPITGEGWGDNSGSAVSMNADGTVVAIGAPINSGNGLESGHVRVFNWNGSIWVQMGSDINGEAAGDRSGSSVSLSADGNIVAIGAYYNDGNGSNSGHTRVFQWNGNAWVQLGADINGENYNDYSGYSVSLSSDGHTLATGAINNDGNGNNAGQVRIFSWETDTWVQKGSDIDGEAANDNSGYSVSLSSDGNTVAIGAPENDGANGTNSGQVRIYEWDNTSWNKIGSDIDGDAQDDKFGTDVSISSDGSIFAASAPFNDSDGNNAGIIKVFTWEVSDWTSIGSYIGGEAINDQLSQVGLSSGGDTLVAGAKLNDGNGSSSGNVRFFTWSGNGWIQLYTDINGENSWDYSGCDLSVSADGTMVAIGALGNDNNFLNDNGDVRIFKYCEYTYSTINPVDCDDYTSPSGKVFTSNGTYMDTIFNSVGCDSIITINLTLYPSYTVNDNPVEGCDSVLVHTNWYYSAQIVKDTLLSIHNCDSIVITPVTVNYTSRTTAPQVIECDSAQIHGKWYYNSQTVIDTFATINNCDSIVSTPLIVNYTERTNAPAVTECDSALIHGEWYYNSQIVIDTLTTIDNCDSIVTTSLTINYSATTNHSPIVDCDSVLFDGTWYYSSQTIIENLKTINNCDSIVSTPLVVNYTERVNAPLVTECDSALINGNWYYHSQTIVDTLSTIHNCDSIVTTPLTINYSERNNVPAVIDCDSVWFRGNWYTSSHTVLEFLTNSDNCDSTVIIPLIVHHLCYPTHYLFGQAPIPYLENAVVYASDVNADSVIYDNFSGIIGGITGIIFWGTTGDSLNTCTENPKDFEISFYTDNGGNVGNLYAQYNLSLTGILSGDSIGISPVLKYEVEFPQAFSILTHGWVSIQGKPSGTCTFRWAASNEGDNIAIVGESKGIINADFAFALNSNPNIPINNWPVVIFILLILAFFIFLFVKKYLQSV